MRLVLVVGLLGLAACSRGYQPTPYPPVSLADSVVTTEAAAVAAVLAWLEHPDQFEPEPIELLEQPGGWSVSLRYVVEPGYVQIPDRAIFRVSKATGEVDIPVMLR